MITDILLDLDDTILDFHAAEKIAVTKTLTAMGINVTDAVLDRYHILNIEQWKKLELGLITRDEVKVKRYEALFEELGVDCSAIDAAFTYENNLAIGHIFIPGALNFLEDIKGKYKLYLVSNGTAVVQAGRIKSAGIARYFDKIFVSEEMGANKPSKEYFDICFNYIKENEHRKIDKSSTIIVGDSLTSDIKGGINAGIRTVWFNRNGEENTSLIIPNYIVSSFEELERMLENE